MNPTYDWIVVGGGLTGAALGYELSVQGFSVLLLEQHHSLQGATRYSYGGISYWAGTTPLTREIGQSSIERYRYLAAELDGDIQFRETYLMLTIEADTDPKTLLPTYQQFAIAPKLLTAAEAQNQEPLLKGTKLNGAIRFPQGHVDPIALTQAYCQALQRRGSTLTIAQVTELLCQGERCIGVKTNLGHFSADRVVICAGGASRALLRRANLWAPVYYTQAELIEIPASTTTSLPRLHSIVMPATDQRGSLETDATHPNLEDLWDQPNPQLPPMTTTIFDAGAVQFQSGHIRLGQISRVFPDPNPLIYGQSSESQIRQGIRNLLPSLADLPGQWHHCPVAFSHDQLPLIGPIPTMPGVYLFSGFTSPFVFVPPLAQRFAQQVQQAQSGITAASQTDPWLSAMGLDR
jgi:glycine/D-amino acid oxidase-like deaminating enzyme